MSNKHRSFVTNARSYSGICTETDHKLVKTNTHFQWQYIYSKQNKEIKINTQNFNKKENQEKYKKCLKSLINEQKLEQNLTSQETWNKIVKSCKQAGEVVLGKVPRNRKSDDQQLQILSRKSQKIRQDINSCKDKNTREVKRKERKEIKKQTKNRMMELKELEINAILTDIESMKDDSNKYHQAVRNLKRLKPKQTLCVQDKEGNIAGIQKQQATFITEYFKEMLGPQIDEIRNTYHPTKMKNEFTADEIQRAAKNMKNSKSAGIDGIIAEYIKYGPEELHQLIANLLTKTAETGEYPEELITGILSALPKPGKPKGPCENLRPIILLCILRKILTICLMQRCWERIKEKIPIDQAAYQPGRSTTEHVFSIKILAEKAITSNDFTLYLFLIDMTKAFDTVDRSKLLSILEEFLNEDEMHLIFILTAKPKLKVKVGKEFGDLFDTTLGVMQGDCLSAILFILYLAKAMKKDVVEVIQYFEIEPKYADDITLVTTMKERQQAAKTTYGAKLAKFNLKENISKREEYTIPKPQPPPPPPTHKQLMKNKATKNCWSDLDWLIMDPPKVKDNTPDWKRCKILGSLLDTKSDIDRRKILARS